MVTETTISYDRTRYHSVRDFIMQALDPGATIQDAIRQGDITRENAAEQAENWMREVIALDPETIEGESDNWRMTTMDASDLERYILNLIDEIEGEDA